MDTIFTNYENSETSDPYRLLLNLTDKRNLKRSDKYVALSNLSIYYSWKIIKKSYKNNKFKILAPTSNEEFELPDGSYSVSDIEDYFEYIIKKHETVIENPSIRKYINKIENRIIFKIKTVYYLELLTPEKLKLLGRTKSKINEDKNGENVPHLEMNEVVLIHCNIVNNDYQQDSRVLHTLVPNKSFGQLLDISPKNLIFLKTFNSEFSYIELWFTDQNSEPLEIENKTNMQLICNG